MSEKKSEREFLPVNIAVLTVSDHLQTGEALDSESRERSFGDMVRIAFEAALPA